MRYPRPWKATHNVFISSGRENDGERYFQVGLYVDRPGTADNGRRITWHPSRAELQRFSEQIAYHLHLDQEQPEDPIAWRAIDYTLPLDSES